MKRVPICFTGSIGDRLFLWSLLQLESKVKNRASRTKNIFPLTE